MLYHILFNSILSYLTNEIKLVTNTCIYNTFSCKIRSNLEIYNTGPKGIKYLIAGKNFSAGVGINSVNCEQTKKDQLKKKFSLIKKKYGFLR